MGQKRLGYVITVAGTVGDVPAYPGTGDDIAFEPTPSNVRATRADKAIRAPLELDHSDIHGQAVL